MELESLQFGPREKKEAHGEEMELFLTRKQNLQASEDPPKPFLPFATFWFYRLGDGRLKCWVTIFIHSTIS